MTTTLIAVIASVTAIAVLVSLITIYFSYRQYKKVVTGSESKPNKFDKVSNKNKKED